MFGLCFEAKAEEEIVPSSEEATSKIDIILKAVEEYDKQGGITNETSKQIVFEVRNILEEEGFFVGASTITATVANLIKSGAIPQDLIDSIYGDDDSSGDSSSEFIEEEIPLANVPKTGDDLFTFVTFCVGSMVALKFYKKKFV